MTFATQFIQRMLSGACSHENRKEIFNNNVEANKLLSRPQRFPYGTSYIVKQKPISEK
jgi:hypothetical protein